MILSHKIRLVPTQAQEDYFRRACGTARFTYNWALAAWRDAYEAGGKPSGRSLKLRFNAIRRVELPWTYDVHRDCTAGAFDNLQSAFRGFFRRVKAGDKSGYPKFKKRGLAKDSFSIANDKFRLDGKKIWVPKLGWVKMREVLRLSGKIMSAVVSRTADQWFVSIAVDTEVTPQPPKTKGAIGVDLGISALATMSDGRKVNHSSKWRKLEKQVRRLQKSVSRKQKGSTSRRKAVGKLARKHLELTSLRVDVLHKTTTELVQDYETIVIEDLNVKGMIKNHCLARAISRQAWAEFRRQLDYKALMHGRDLVVADRFYPSTKTCSGCRAATSLKGPGLTQEDADLFEAALVAELSKEEHLVLSTDYGPDDVLYQAYVTALGREPARHSFPWKTVMRFRAGGVCVSVGRGAPFVSIAG